MSSEEVRNLLQTKVVFHAEARKALFQGLEIAAQAVTCTLGPKGKTVIIQNPNGQPIVTKDGVTVSKAIKLKDPILRMGAELIQEAASQTNDKAGDGTTTATLLTYYMARECLRLIENGADRQLVSKGLAAGVKKIIAVLQQNSEQISSKEDLAKVATISANNDATIGELIANALFNIGSDGIVTVEDAKGIATTVTFAEGMLVERGFVSPYFINNNDKQNASYKNARVLIYEGKLTQMKPLVPALEQVSRAGQPLLIIADEIEGEALQTLIVNKVQNNLKFVAIKSPGYGTLKEQLLQDIAVFTGAKIASAKTGLALDKVTLNDLGTIKQVTIDSKSTTLIADSTNDEAVKARAEELRKQLQDITLNAEDAHKLRIRLARLTSGAAVIKVGGITEIEMIERKHRIEDALNATRAAAEEGVVSGGGYALFEAKQLVMNSLTGDEGLGFELVLKTCEGPVTKIVENAGGSPEVVKLMMARDNLGYNAAKDEYVDMIKAGIIDPLKVTRTALENAASVAQIFLSLDAAVVEE